MKRYNKFFGFAVSLILLTLLACSHDDDIFDETPQERKNAQLSKLDTLLSANSPFKGAYFPKDDEYGGSVIFFDFDGEEKVRMSSGFDEDTDIAESFYEIKYNSSVELNFSTFNHITKLADNDLPGLRGTGFEGTNNFIFLGGDDAEGVLLKDPRNNSTFALEPISEEEFKTAEEKSEMAFENRQHLTSPIGSVFQQLIVKSNDETRNFDLNFESNKLHASPEERGEDGGIKEQLDFGVAFTANGLTVSPAIGIDNDSIKDFDYDEGNDNFVAALDDGTEVILGSSDEPAFIPDDYKDLFEINGPPLELGWQPNSFGTSDLTTQSFVDYFNEGAGALAETGRIVDLYQLNINSLNEENGALLIIQYISGGTSRFNANYIFDTKVEDNKLFLTYKGPANDNGELWEDELKPIREFFTGDKGLLIESRGSFSASNASYTNPSATITNMNDPSMRVYNIIFPQ